MTRIIEYLESNPCIDCGESDPIVLTFDHVKGEKEISVSKAVSDGWSWGSIKKEIEKCVVRCFNCHMRKTAKEEEYKIYEKCGEGE